MGVIVVAAALILQGCYEAECESDSTVLSNWTCAVHICPDFYRHRWNIDQIRYIEECATNTCCTRHWYAYPLVWILIGCSSCFCVASWCLFVITNIRDSRQKKFIE